MEAEWLETLLKREKKIGEPDINCILSVEQEPAVAKGENFASIILRCKVVVVLTNGEKSTRYLILKTIPECSNGAAYCTETSVFRNEIFVSDTIIYFYPSNNFDYNHVYISGLCRCPKRNGSSHERIQR